MFFQIDQMEDSYKILAMISLNIALQSAVALKSEK